MYIFLFGFLYYYAFEVFVTISRLTYVNKNDTKLKKNVELKFVVEKCNSIDKRL